MQSFIMADSMSAHSFTTAEELGEKGIEIVTYEYGKPPPGDFFYRLLCDTAKLYGTDVVHVSDVHPNLKGRITQKLNSGGFANTCTRRAALVVLDLLRRPEQRREFARQHGELRSSGLAKVRQENEADV